MLEQNIAHRPPEIPPIGAEGMLVIGFDISLFRFLNFFDGLGRFFVVVERGQEARLHADMQFLHLLGVHSKVLPAERPHPHKFHLSLKDIDSHRDLIDPGAAKQAAPMIHPVIMRELTAFLQAFMLEDIRLEILRIRDHRAELVHAD